MVISCGDIGYRFAKDVKQQLEKGNCKILGAILNRVPTKSSSYYSRYYRKYYGKYSRYSGYGKYSNAYGSSDYSANPAPKKKKK
jgi:Mrp family chromosome partitioning ATPase